MHLDRSLSGTGTDIRVKIRVHRILDEVDEDGFYKLIDHTRLTLLFHNARLQSLSMDMFPDILMDLKLQSVERQEENDPSFEVRLVATGIIDFVCEKAEIVDVIQLKNPSG